MTTRALTTWPSQRLVLGLVPRWLLLEVAAHVTVMTGLGTLLALVALSVRELAHCLLWLVR